MKKSLKGRKNSIRWIFVICLLAGPLLFVWFVVDTFSIIWRANDNTAIAIMAAEGYLVRYTHSLVAVAVDFATSHVSDQVAWFACLLLFAHALALILFFAALVEAARDFLRDGPNPLRVAALTGFTVVYLIAHVNMLVRLDFTAAALMLGVNALMFFAARLARERVSIWVLMIAAATLCLSAMIRVAAFKGVVLIAAPFLAVALACLALRGQISSLMAASRAASAVAIVILPALAVTGGDVLYKHTLAASEYQAYEVYNATRGQLHLSGYTIPPNQKVLEAAGWQQIDWDRFANWMFFDEHLYGQDRLSALSAQMSRRSTLRQVMSEFGSLDWLSGHLRRIEAHGQSLLPAWLGVFLLALVPVIEGRRPRTGFVCLFTAVVVMLYPVALGFGTSLMAKFPFRLALPVFVSALGCLWIYATSLQLRIAGAMDQTGEPRGTRVRTTLSGREPINRLSALTQLAGVAAIGAAVFVMADLTSRQIAEAESLKSSYRHEIEALHSVGRDPVFIVQPGLLDFGNRRALAPAKPDITRVPLGWQTFSPRFYDILRREFGISHGHQLLQAAARQDDVYLFATPQWLQLLHSMPSAQSVTFSKIKELPRQRVIYRMGHGCSAATPDRPIWQSVSSGGWTAPSSTRPGC